MKQLILLFTLLGLSQVNGQSYSSEDYNWGEAKYDVLKVDDSTNVYDILNKRLFHYYYNSNNDLIAEYLFHRKAYINSNDAIERLNKIYISQSKDNIRKFMARVINSSGKTIEITEEKILKGVDEDTEQEYVYFAMEGLEVGSQIEYFFIKEINPTLNGLLQNIQGYEPIQRYELDIISPWNLVMGTKIYNIEAEFKSDTSNENENHLYLHLDSVLPMKREESTFTEAYLGRSIFKLDRNLYTGKTNIYAYSHIAQRVVDNLNGELSKKEIKTLARIEKEIAAFEPENKISDIRRMENYLKTNFQYLNYGGEPYYKINSVYQNKSFNELGGLILYTHLLKNMGVDYSIVYTTDRSELPFDPDFATHLYLEDILLYITEEDAFIDISSPFTRMGYINELNRHNYGLFIEETKLNGTTVAISSTDFIKARPAAFTADTLVVDVSFGDDFVGSSLNVERVLSGYSAGFYQPILDFIKDGESRKNLEESILQYVDSEAEVSAYDIQNARANLLGVKPLRAKGKLTTNNFIENAGTSFLFKVGLLIGPQTEMYEDEKDRTLDIQTTQARSYHRTITFQIPEGYEISGLEALNMDEKLMYNNELSGRFVSSFSQEGDMITIVIEEFYDEVYYPKELFEEYRNVINAAADFNKKTVLLKKAS